MRNVTRRCSFSANEDTKERCGRGWHERHPAVCFGRVEFFRTSSCCVTLSVNRFIIFVITGEIYIRLWGGDKPCILYHHKLYAARSEVPSAPPDHLASCTLPKNPTPALGPSGLSSSVCPLNVFPLGSGWRRP